MKAGLAASKVSSPVSDAKAQPRSGSGVSRMKSRSGACRRPAASRCRGLVIRAAELMGWEDRVGSIAPGKYADLIAVEGDALADLRSFMRVGFVMKGGVVYKR